MAILGVLLLFAPLCIAILTGNPAIDEDGDGQFSEEEIRLLVRDMMPELQNVTLGSPLP